MNGRRRPQPTGTMMATLADLADYFLRSLPEQDRGGMTLADFGRRYIEAPTTGGALLDDLVRPGLDLDRMTGRGRQPTIAPELRSYTPPPTERLKHWAMDVADRLGARRDIQQNWGSAAQGLANLSVVPALADMAFHAGRGEPVNTTLAAIGATPGAGGAFMRAAEKEIGSGIRTARSAAKSTELPMDEASRAIRAKQMGYADDAFYRGERNGTAPTRYRDETYFARDKEKADSIAHVGGLPEAREFRLNLGRAYKDYEPLTVSAYARLVGAVAPKSPELAAEMIESIAPGRSGAWLAEYAKRNPDRIVTDPTNTTFLREAIKTHTRDLAGVLRRAGYDAIDTGGDVLKLTGEGIRHKDAMFDPAKSRSKNIFSSMAGAAPLVPLASGNHSNPE